MSAKTDMKLEVVVIPVSDVERSKGLWCRIETRARANLAIWRRVLARPTGSERGTCRDGLVGGAANLVRTRLRNGIPC